MKIFMADVCEQDYYIIIIVIIVDVIFFCRILQ